VALALLAAGCGDDGTDEPEDPPDEAASEDTAATTTTAVEGVLPGEVLVFNAEGNNLNAYDTDDPAGTQRVITSAAEDPEGLDINAQICFFPDGSGRFIAGEDTGQPDPPAGWGIFQLRGTGIGDLEAEQIGKLTPTYQEGAQPENYGCGILSDGRVVTSDIGNQSAGDGNGQLIIWFPPFTKGFEVQRDGTNGSVPYCKVDIGIATAGGVAVDADDDVYVASARPPTAGVWKYSGPFPTSATPDGGCDTTDGTGAPLTTSVQKELFIAVGEHGLVSPNAIVAAPGSTSWYVSSVFTGVINEYDTAGTYVRTVLEPPEGEGPGPEPISTGSPLGLGVAPDGTLYFADIGLVISDEGVGPGDRTGSVRRIRFVDGAPQPPETLADGLAFPDGIGVFVPPRRR
jgi:hypothetical protein